MPRIAWTACTLVIALALSAATAQPLSKPVASDADLPASELASQPSLVIEDVLFGTRLATINARACLSLDDFKLDLLWSTHASAGIYGTPVINHRDHGKSIVVPTMSQHLSVIDGDGVHVRGSPLTVAASGSSSVEFHSSPVLIDLNNDGADDFVWVNVDGAILVVNGDLEAQPRLLFPVIRIPKLKVRRAWHVGLRDDVYNPNTEQQQSQPGRRLLSVDSNYVNDTTVDSTFAHLLDNLPPEAVASLILFTNDADSSLIHLDDHTDIEYPLDDEHIWIDSHVLATPILADLDNDGRTSDLVIAVSYYFDMEEFERDPHRYQHLPPSSNPHDFVAGGLYAINLDTLDTVLAVHLDLTTDRTALTALIYASPVVVDLDGDGEMEIIIGTGLGLVYVLDTKGEVRAGFPFVMGEIQAAVSVEDINDDGELEIVAMDARGNVVAISRHGQQVWKAQVSGLASQPASVGDIDGDGHLDVVIATNSGQVWALNGTNGQPLKNFPLKTGGQILAPVTMVRLDSPKRKAAFQLPLATLGKADEQLKSVDGSASQAVDVQAMFEEMFITGRRDRLHLLFASFDGNVYLADGLTGCSRAVDLGERVYAKILVDDLTNDGHLSFLVSSMNGNIHALGTDSHFHPSMKQLGHSNEPSVLPFNFHSVHFTQDTRHRNRRSGATLTLSFNIVDQRAKRVRHVGTIPAKYRVLIFLIGHSPLPVFEATYNSTGEHSISFPSPSQPFDGLAELVLINEHGQRFVDTLELEVNKQFHRTVKYLVLAPFLLAAAMLTLSKQSTRTELPA